jgi:hypothetical protein
MRLFTFNRRDLVREPRVVSGEAEPHFLRSPLDCCLSLSIDYHTWCHLLLISSTNRPFTPFKYCFLIFASITRNMSFLGGAECSTAGNPISQFTKHVQDDKSLQRDRLVGRGPGGVQDSMRSQAMGPGQDKVCCRQVYNYRQTLKACDFR